MDLTGARVITFFPKTVEEADQAINSEFQVFEKSDKAHVLRQEERLGYQSVHYLATLKQNRTALPEYRKFKNLVAEIQVRTILQHAWAEIEHDIQYKSVETIPSTLRRRFMSLAGLFEIADREFQAIQDEDELLRRSARRSVLEGRLEGVGITADALKAYLDGRLGSDGRMTPESYEWTAKMLHRMGFDNLQQIDECIAGFDHDKLSRVVWGTRQGQLSRFETQLLASMGEGFVKAHSFGQFDWFVKSRLAQIAKLNEAGVKVGCYRPGKVEGSVSAGGAGRPSGPNSDTSQE